LEIEKDGNIASLAEGGSVHFVKRPLDVWSWQSQDCTFVHSLTPPPLLWSLGGIKLESDSPFFQL
ncbi:MAG TPA: hypothetical protein PKA70_03555, partial [Saprospiraceae bacterium]|nr:hypothetical protein [Saprospiraceae bacterium]